MMRRFLMTGMAAVALGGLFSSCSKEMESVEGSNSVAQDIVANYEAAFITRFGQPDPSQTWGFGPITSGTRAVVSSPSVTEEGYTFNAQMAKAWEGVDGTPSYMAYYTSWRNSGWNDKFYTVNGTVVNSTISSKLKEEIYKVIVGENGEGGLIPEGENNLQTAQSTGYSIVTKGGPVTLTPIYHNSSSGDKISYYYYPQGSTPDVKTLKKYTIGNMADPATCQNNHTALNSNTYSLVYEDANGNVSYDFPENYVINFIISNTDLGNGNVEIPDDKIVAEKDWTGVAGLPGFVQFAYDGQGSANMVDDGISITVNNRGNYWEPQLSVLDGFNLARGGNYKVVVKAKFPTNGQLQINMGEWGDPYINNFQYDFPVEATGAFQEVECEFLNYGADVANGNGHVLFQCGNFLGTTIFKSVKVIELAAKTKTIANSPEFYGDGNYNQQIHNCTRPLWEGKYHWGVSPATTPHAAVFDAKCTDEDGQTIDVSLIGFEDWTDLDFNDVIFAVTGTKKNDDPPVIIEVPDPEPEPLFRIVAEDLTVDERGDFDFNDVVFDVCPDATTGKTTLIIRAVGGELPLYIGLEGDPLDDAHDVHKVCGIGEMSMTNTGWDGPIKYDRKCGEIVLNTLINDRGAARNNIYVRVIKKKETIRLSATPGRVPSMICVGTDYKWCPERKDIDDIYHTSENVKLFSEYVAGRLGDNWYQLVDQSGN